MDMSLREAHTAFIQSHLAKRSGERRSRLERGHAHAESLFAKSIWWPLKHSFTDLHPEYEVLDWRGNPYYADFAWLPGFIRLLIEIKGFKSHIRDMDRVKFSKEINRETFLHGMGYQVISFAYDDVEQHPSLCISLLRMVLNQYQPSQQPITRLHLVEREIILLTIQLARAIRPIDIQNHFQIDHKTAVSMLRKLYDKGYLTPVIRENGQRIVGYKLTSAAFSSL
jgi:hypothetical protein